MGCVSSSSQDPNDAREVEENKNGENKDNDENQKAIQRRRLSVAPQHVDTKDPSAKAQPSSVADPVSNLNDLEKKVAAKILHAVESRKGVVPANNRKVNQDRAIVKFALAGDENIQLFGVMDGHGEFGHLVAQHVQEKLPANFQAIGKDEIRSNPQNAILAAVKKTCDQLTQTGINCAFSGLFLPKSRKI